MGYHAAEILKLWVWSVKDSDGREGPSTSTFYDGGVFFVRAASPEELTPFEVVDTIVAYEVDRTGIVFEGFTIGGKPATVGLFIHSDRLVGPLHIAYVDRLNAEVRSLLAAVEIGWGQPIEFVELADQAAVVLEVRHAVR